MSGGTPRKLNALPESRIPLIVSGANSPVSNTLPGQVAITSEKADNFAISQIFLRRIRTHPLVCCGAAKAGRPDLARFGVGIRIDQHAVHCTEERSRCTNAECEHEHGGDEKARMLEVLTKRKSDVVHTNLTIVNLKGDVAYDIFHRAAWTPWDDPPRRWHELRQWK